MRRKNYKIFFIVVMTLLPMVGKSQNYHFKDIIYYSIGVGPNINLCENSSTLGHVGFQGNASLGVNLFQHLGGRIQFSLLHTTNAHLNPGFYLTGHVDATLRLFRIVTPRKDAAHEMFLIIGAGAIRRFQNEYGPTSNAFCVVPGLIYNCPITPATQLSFELSSNIILNDFDANEYSSAINTFYVGLVHHLNSNPRRNGIIDGFYPFRGNWFISASLGINSLQYKGIANISERLKQITPAVEFTIGKQLSSILSLRFGFSGIQVATSIDKSLFANGHLDAIIDITNIINNTPYRKFNFSAYGGGGLIMDFDSKRPTIQANVGLIAQLNLSKKSEIFADLRYNMIHYNFANYPGQKLFSVGIASFMVGYRFNLGER